MITNPNVDFCFDKTMKVVLSCKTIFHIAAAQRMINNFAKIFPTGTAFTELLSIYLKKRSVVLDNYGLTLEGTRCISVSNEDQLPEIGTVQRFYDWDKVHQSFIPIVLFESNGKEYICFSILVPYDEKVYKELCALPYKERWNSLCKPHSKME